MNEKIIITGERTTRIPDGIKGKTDKAVKGKSMLRTECLFS